MFSRWNKQIALQKLVRNWLAPPAGQDWVLEAEWARIMQTPVKARGLLYCVVGVTSSACLPHCLYTSSPTPIDYLLYNKNDKRCLNSL